PSTDTQPSLVNAQKRAAKFDSLLTIPIFETTPAQIQASVDLAIAKADSALDQVGKLPPDQTTFENTIRALDDIGYDAMTVANRIYLLKETSQDPELRDAATEATKRFEAWSVGLDYREDVYKAVRAYADSNPQLSGESQRLFEETLRDYKRAGLSLAKPERDVIEALRKKLAGLTTDFRTHVTKARKPMTFTKAELAGAPESFLGQKGVKTGDDEYTVMANITFHYLVVMENATSEATRKKLKIARYTLAEKENAALLQQIVLLRDNIARKLGYATWADYKTEPKMAKTGDAAIQFIRDLKDGLQPKLATELNEFRKLKARDTGNPNAKINIWDWRYYSNQLKKEKYTVDTEKLRVYFPYKKVLQGMFDIYEHCFGLTISPIDPGYKWVADLTLHLISDSETGEPLGLVYLDMFPREGKFNHFAQFGIIEGKRLPSGEYQRPTVALICNFPPAEADKPSLLSHGEVETLFHEFGHALHSVLTRAEFSRFSGTSVPRDFVEAPSQMLEAWIWDKSVLDAFAADYRDPSKKIPESILAKMEEAKLATIGTFYRRQLSFGLLDLALHSQINSMNKENAVELSNKILSDVFLPVPEGTTFVTYFGHLMGYDAGYYGYAWADAIAADMETVFKEAPYGFYDKAAGRRLRDEIYAPGGSRDVEESIRIFLGRERSIEPFLKKIGIEGN
ncbi:MAG: thimet oligopeptidase, partial [Candidatus Binatia bacterium]